MLAKNDLEQISKVSKFLSELSNQLLQYSYAGWPDWRKFALWATFKVFGDFLGENMVYCRYLDGV